MFSGSCFEISRQNSPSAYGRTHTIARILGDYTENHKIQNLRQIQRSRLISLDRPRLELVFQKSRDQRGVPVEAKNLIDEWNNAIVLGQVD